MKIKIVMLSLTIFCCFSCTHPKDGELVRDKNGNYFILDGEDDLMPQNAYRLKPVDTTKYKVVGFK